MMLAAQHDAHEVIAWLLKEVPEARDTLEWKDAEGNTALLIAAREQCRAGYKALVE